MSAQIELCELCEQPLKNDWLYIEPEYPKNEEGKRYVAIKYRCPNCGYLNDVPHWEVSGNLLDNFWRRIPEEKRAERRV